MIENISGPASVPNFSSKGPAASEQPASQVAAEVAGADAQKRLQEPNAGRVSAQERIDVAANDNPAPKIDSVSLSIMRNDEVNRFVYRGMNRSTQEVERQWPTEEALRQMTVFRDMMGKVFDKSG
jgi:uncharacterized FlaG/YvyC family protein